jgi:hypothetical protein
MQFKIDEKNMQLIPKNDKDKRLLNKFGDMIVLIKKAIDDEGDFIFELKPVVKQKVIKKKETD